jgi:phage-related protein
VASNSRIARENVEARFGHRLTLHPAYANIGMCQRMKNLTWLADSRSTVKSFPAGVQDDIGYALYAAQLGELSVKAKPLHGLGGQVMEIAAHDASGTYRAVYTVSIGESIYLPEEVQGRDRDAQVGDGTHPAAAQTVKK